MLNSRTSRFVIFSGALFLVFSMVAMDHAEARRGGSFGSRGTRTFQAAPPTKTAPAPTAPIERSAVPNGGVNNAARQPAAGLQRPGFMNWFGGSMMRGLMLGGLIGLLMGQGLGGLAGMFGFLLQALLIGGAIMFTIRFFRSRSASTPAMAGASRTMGSFKYEGDGQRSAQSAPSFSIPGIGSASATHAPANDDGDIALEKSDLDTFQRLLTEVQGAFGREDHSALSRLATPEMVSYLSEELADNAHKGLRNEVSDITLLEADVAESWRDDDYEFATAALRYSSLDVTRESASGRIVEGNADRPTEVTELWTFTRRRGADWMLSAIQETHS